MILFFGSVVDPFFGCAPVVILVVEKDRPACACSQSFFTRGARGRTCRRTRGIMWVCLIGICLCCMCLFVKYAGMAHKVVSGQETLYTFRGSRPQNDQVPRHAQLSCQPNSQPSAAESLLLPLPLRPETFSLSLPFFVSVSAAAEVKGCV